ncbi:magnesium/cobalt transporter CorA [Bellilinea sp.]|uniref:magnesium/cobalt transporter CorA n=1 Tax=Bellilinea sp. TaxID=2838785 RepID=UPI002ADD92B4|nr:magnesium/cobalt transporter CorA [Bellilinea sp.]
MISIVYFPKIGAPQLNLPFSALRSALADREGLVWVALEEPDEEEITRVMVNQFHFHPLAVEDCQSDGYQTPKLDDYGEYLFLVVQSVTSGGLLEGDTTRELNIFLGDHYLVSSSLRKVTAVEKLRKRLERDERIYQNGSDFLCHALLDQVVDEFIPHIDQLEEEIDFLEEAVLSNPDPQTLQRILRLKRYSMNLRRVISPQREVINRLCRDDFPMIDPHSQMYFRDVYDHLVRIFDMLDGIRDMTTSALEVYLNATSLRLNEVMKALTIVSTIFLPLSFVAGVYGMNFHYMPELGWRWGYPLVWLVFVLIAIGMLGYFRKRRWF